MVVSLIRDVPTATVPERTCVLRRPQTARAQIAAIVNVHVLTRRGRSFSSVVVETRSRWSSSPRPSPPTGDIARTSLRLASRAPAPSIGEGRPRSRSPRRSACFASLAGLRRFPRSRHSMRAAEDARAAHRRLHDGAAPPRRQACSLEEPPMYCVNGDDRQERDRRDPRAAPDQAQLAMHTTCRPSRSTRRSLCACSLRFGRIASTPDVDRRTHAPSPISRASGPATTGMPETCSPFRTR